METSLSERPARWVRRYIVKAESCSSAASTAGYARLLGIGENRLGSNRAATADRQVGWGKIKVVDGANALVIFHM